METKPNYFSIIPANVRYDNRLTPLQKLLFSEITALTNKTGECWATNKYFASLYDVTETWISLSIKKLADLNYINLRFQNNEGTERFISIVNLNEEIKLELKEDLIKVKGGDLTKVKEGGLTKVKTNNININNININKYINNSKTKHTITDEEINWLNNLDDETINSIVKEINCTKQQVKDFAIEVAEQCQIKAYKYANYKLVLKKWIRNKYGKRLSEKEFKKKEVEEWRKEYPGLQVYGGGYDGL